MNKERMLALADFINESETYDQRSYEHECGTPACIAGHAAVLFGMPEGEDWVTWTADALDLTHAQARQLYAAFPFPKSGGNARREDAVATILRAADRGYVLWGESMNRKNLLALADFIEESETYDQRKFISTYGTPGCIAGHACALFGIDPENLSVVDALCGVLGLNPSQRHALFRAFPEYEVQKERPDRHDAAATLRHAANTGRIQWKVRP